MSTEIINAIITPKKGRGRPRLDLSDEERRRRRTEQVRICREKYKVRDEMIASMVRANVEKIFQLANPGVSIKVRGGRPRKAKFEVSG